MITNEKCFSVSNSLGCRMDANKKPAYRLPLAAKRARDLESKIVEKRLLDILDVIENNNPAVILSEKFNCRSRYKAENSALQVFDDGGSATHLRCILHETSIS